jgi:hypothetical protein
VTDAERTWRAIQNTTSRAMTADFIRQFGNIPFGGIARAMIALQITVRMRSRSAGTPICAGSILEMDAFYNRLKSALNANRQTTLTVEQGNWLKTPCASNVPCPLERYQSRIAQLQSWLYPAERGQDTRRTLGAQVRLSDMIGGST